MRPKTMYLGIFLVTLYSGIGMQVQKTDKRQAAFPEKIMERLDSDKDGKLVREEVTSASRGKLTKDFDAIDMNSDEFIDMEELKRYLSAAGKERREQR